MNTSTLMSVDQQLLYIADLLDDMHDALQNARPASLPPRLSEMASSLAAAMPNFRKQVQAQLTRVISNWAGSKFFTGARRSTPDRDGHDH
jgi:hypothetical protein